MTQRESVVTERKYWVLGSGIVSLAFWVVALGVGWRAWILSDPSRGIVAHVADFGRDAMPWMVVAAILTVTTAVLGVGLAVVRHLVDGPGARPVPALEPKEPLTPLAPQPTSADEPAQPQSSPADVSDGAGSESSAPEAGSDEPT